VAPHQPAGPGSRRSASPAEAKQLRALRRRQQAAEWVHAVTGANVPADTDAAFRASLADGVVLCKLLNWLRPNTIPRVVEGGWAVTATGEVIATLENVTNFIAAAAEFTAASFSAADLEEGGERPQVVECVLSLRDWQHGAYQSGAATPPPGSGGYYATPPHGGGGHYAPPPNIGGSVQPIHLGSASRQLPQLQQQHTPRYSGGGGGGEPSPEGRPAAMSFTPAAAHLVQKHGVLAAMGAEGGAGGAPDGLNYLMRSCTHLLKQRMGLPATPLPPPPRGASGASSEIALDAVGPVLETVLANLTSVSGSWAVGRREAMEGRRSRAVDPT
jgi:hypothetical protein